jgi:pimeloyl-ACP methyl ester carboxylesterase
MSLFLAILALPILLLAAGAVFARIYAWRADRLYPPTGRFIDVHGCRLHYRETGPAGTPLGTIVLLHGASSNLVESMLGLGSPLAARYRILAFDRPGHGWSERKPGLDAANPDRQAASIAEALRRLDVRNAVIVGHSWSGAIVPHFGLDHTDVAGALVVLSGITHPWPGGYIAWYKRLIASWIGRLLVHTLAIPVTLLLRPYLKGKTFSPQVAPPGFLERAFIPLAFRPRTYYANAQDFGVMYDAVARQSPRYGEIRLPTLVIGGDRDEIVWTDLHSRSFARDVPGAKLVIVPGAGHMPQYARPDLVLSAIEALAERIAPARAVQDRT